MARIRTYDLDTTITDKDYLLGNDGDGSAVITKRFALTDLKDFLGQGVNLTDQATPGFLAYTDPEASDLKQAILKITSGNRTELVLDIDDISEIGGISVRNSNEQGNDIEFVINTNNSTIDLRMLDGISFSATLDNGTLDVLTGTFGSLIPFKDTVDTATRDYEFEASGNYWTVGASLGEGVSLPTTLDGIQLNALTLGDGWFARTLEIFGNTTIIGDLQLSAAPGTGEGNPTGKLDLDGDLNVGGNTDIDGTLNVDGTSQFNDEVSIGRNDPDEPVNLNVHGDIHLLDAQSKLIFGEPDPSVVFQTDGDNLDIAGNGDVTFNTNVTVEGADHKLTLTDADLVIDNSTEGDSSSITITDMGITQVRMDGTTLPEIEPTSANAVSGGHDAVAPSGMATFQGVLDNIQIGDNWWNIPTAINSVAQILPGLYEGLTPTPSQITTGYFWYGIDQGTFATYESDPTTQLTTPLVIPSGVTAIEVTDTDDQDDLEMDFRDVPFGQRLFFTTSTNTFVFPPAAGTTVTGQTYEVVNYDSITHELDFTLIGEGNIVISAPTVSLTNLPDNTSGLDVFTYATGTAASNDLTFMLSKEPVGDVTFSSVTNATITNEGRVVTFEYTGAVTGGTFTATYTAVSNSDVTLIFADDDGNLSKNTVKAVAGQQAVLNYQNLTEDTAGSVASIEFKSGPNCHNIVDGGGDIEVDISGRFPFANDANPIEITFDGTDYSTLPASLKTLEVWRSYILGNIRYDESDDTTAPESNRTVMLPTGDDRTSGDVIKLINVSDRDITGGGGAISSGNWIIASGSTDKIMGLPSTEPLILNTTETVELVWSNGPAGWLIQ